MNEKRAKLEFIEERLGSWPANFERTLAELTDHRNQIVHGDVKATTARAYSGRKAFQVVLRAVMFLIEMLYRDHPAAETNEGRAQ
ncbi:MAG: hypothetical protein MAG453_00906 [Calditrichaeota bacterium]|nr:hypothetical protein [Calditrichota bacterium]